MQTFNGNLLRIYVIYCEVEFATASQTLEAVSRENIQTLLVYSLKCIKAKACMFSINIERLDFNKPEDCAKLKCKKVDMITSQCMQGNCKKRSQST